MKVTVVTYGGRLIKIAATDICQDAAKKREGGRRPMAQRRTVQVTACLLMLSHKNLLNYIPYLKLFAFVFLLEILEIFLCLLLVPHVKLVSLQDMHQPQIPFANILIYSVQILLHLIIF
jgi:hypothetical protein